MSWKRLAKNIAGKMLGLTPHDMYILRTMRHFWWLYAPLFPTRTPIPTTRLTRLPQPSNSQADQELCKRIITAYWRSNAETGVETAVSPLWQEILGSHYARLTALIRSDDSKALSEALSNMFSSEFVYGVDTGNLYTGKNWRVYSLKLLGDLVSLAEQLGVVRTESGQAAVGEAFAGGLEKLVRDTESALGVSLNFPAIGGAYGIVIGDRFLTLQCCEYAYVAWRLSRVAESLIKEDKFSVLEVGAGYGGAAMYFANIAGNRLGRYIIVDLPIMNVLQAYFLGKVFGANRLALFGENDAGSQAPLFTILPGTSISLLEPVDILFNENSFPEMPYQTITSYLEWARTNVQRFIFSYNHETLTVDRHAAVVTVPEVMSAVGGFKRVSRNLSWLRTGYVEEVWGKQ